MANISARVRDYSDEYSNATIRVADAVVQTWDLLEGVADEFNTYVDALSLGTVASMTRSQETQASNDSRPASPFAQRETGFRFFLRDTTNDDRTYFTIPAADLAIDAVVAGKDELDLSAASVSGFVTWIEANVLSKQGNAVVVERAVIVGRSN